MNTDFLTSRMLWRVGLPFLLQLVTVYAAVSSDPCFFWPNSVYVNGKCYKIFSVETTWGEAQQYCEQEDEGGTLAEMVTEEELAVLVEMVKKEVNNDSVALWVGASDVTQEGQWVWSRTQSPVPVGEIWATSQTSSLSGVGHCVVTRSGLLHVMACDSGESEIFICQRPSLMVLDPCYFWENAIYVNGKCFGIFVDPKNWIDAQTFCENYVNGGTLGEVLYEEERVALSEVMNTLSLVVVWFGARDVETEGTFVWTRAETGVGNAWWSPGNPNNHLNNEGCLDIQVVEGLFNDNNCGVPFPFVCQVQIENPCNHFLPDDSSEFYHGHCFTFLEGPLSWEDAAERCNKAPYFGHLAEPATSDLKKYVDGMANRCTENSTDKQVWLGGVREDDLWQWASAGTNVTNREFRSDDNIDSFLLLDSLTGAWLSSSSGQHSFICQRELGDRCEVFFPGGVFTQGVCLKYFNLPLSWPEAQAFCSEKDASLAQPKTRKLSDALNLYLKRMEAPANNEQCAEILPEGQYILGHCFKLMSTPKTWYGAKESCESMNAILAEIKTSELVDAVGDYVRNDTEIIIWLGGSDEEEEGVFKWVTSGDVFGKDIKTRWGVGHPNNANNIEHHVNLIVQPGINFVGLQDRPGNNPFPYICQAVNKAWIGATDEQEEGSFRWIDTNNTLTFAAFPTPNPVNPDRDHVIVIDSSYWKDENSAAKYPFVCQATVSKKHRRRKYTAVLPILQLVSAQEGYLQLTHGYSSFGVIVGITVTSGTESYVLSKRVPPHRALHYDLTSELAVSSTGQYIRQLIMRALYPLTVVMYIHSATAVESTLVFFHKIQKSTIFGTTKSYFLISGVTGEVTDNAVLVLAAAQSPTVTIMFPVSNWIQVNDISFGPVTLINTILPIEATAYISSNNSDGAYLFTSHGVQVMVTGAAVQSSGGEPDFTIEYVLPVQDISTEYVTFPSFPENVTREDVFRFVATEANTLVEIYQCQAANGTIQIYLDIASDVKEVTLPAQGFYYMKGNSHFYAYKVARSESGLPSCLTSLFHINLWRHQYDFETTSRLDGYDVYIAAIVPASMTSLLTMKYVNNSDPVCQNITGSDLAGCYYHLPKDHHFYYHLHLTNHMARFAAYVFATKQGSSLCHPMGVKDEIIEIHDFDYVNYLASLQSANVTSAPPPICPPPVTDTTSISNNNSTIQQSTTSSDITAATLNTTTGNATISTTSVTTSNNTSVTEPSSEFSDGTTSYMGVSSPTTGISNTTNNPGMQNTQDVVDQIYRTLRIDKESTSSYRRKKISIPDGRPSSVTIGSVAIIFISIVLGIFLLGDLLTIMKECDISSRKNKK